MNFNLGEEIEAIRDTVRSTLPVRKLPRGPDEIDKTNSFPNDLWEKMGALGLHGITVFKADGGAEMGYLAHCIVIEEISRASASVGLSYGAHSNLCVNQVARWGTPEQKARYLPKLISGEHIGSLAMSEPGAGSDVVSMKLQAEKRNDRFVLNGNKMWITNSPDASTLIVYAKTDMDAGPRGITAFMIERDMAGFSVGAKLDKLGMRGSNTAELIFDNCEVPFENILGEEGKGVNVLMSGWIMNGWFWPPGHWALWRRQWILLSLMCMTRNNLANLLAHQLMQGKLADMYTTMNACRAYVYAVAAACDRSETTRKDYSAGCILYAAEKATQIALEAIQCLGGNGYIGYATGRLLRDAKLYEIGAGTSEIRRMLIGRELFNETA